jgi:hypothetical protein
VFSALTYNSSIPQTSEEQKRKNAPPGTDAKIRRYQKFREEHDPAWVEAQSHPVRLYEFFNLNAEVVRGYIGSPPERKVKTASEMGKGGSLLEDFASRLDARLVVQSEDG